MFSKFASLVLALAFATQTTNTPMLTAQAQGLASPPSAQVAASKQLKQQHQNKQRNASANAHAETKKEEIQKQTQTALEKALLELASKLDSTQLAPGIEQTVATGVFGEEVELEGDSTDCKAPSCVYLPAMVEVQVFAKASREKTQDPRTQALSETPHSLSQLMAYSFAQDKTQFMPDKVITVPTGPFLFLANGVSYFLTDLRFTVKLRSENSEPHNEPDSEGGSQLKRCK